MAMMGRRQDWQYLLLLLSYLSLALAASPTTFCKCTCFTNSTIIPLTAVTTISPVDNTTRLESRTCNDCTKRFCLDYNLPICAEATETDVVTKCFQRDSTKDEAIVLLFIFATGGLLVWAAIKPWVVKYRSRSTRYRGNYGPVMGEG